MHQYSFGLRSNVVILKRDKWSEFHIVKTYHLTFITWGILLNFPFGYNDRLLPLFWRLIVISNTTKKSVDLIMPCPTSNLYYLWCYLSIHDNLYPVNELLKCQMAWVSLWRDITYAPMWRHKETNGCKLCLVINSPLRAKHNQCQSMIII